MKENRNIPIQNEGRVISKDLNDRLFEFGKEFEEVKARLGIKERKK